MNEPPDLSAPINLLASDGMALLYPAVCTSEESFTYFNALQEKVSWEQEAIRMFGKTVMQPRLTAWYGDEGMAYSYSGITMQPLPWIPELLQLKEMAEHRTACMFNSALLNLYRDGNDSMGWHRDNERELGPEPAIASFSFGAERIFRFRNYKDKNQVISLPLATGSLLIMQGATQLHWEHQLPKSARVKSPRINITFRSIKR